MGVLLLVRDVALFCAKVYRLSQNFARSAFVKILADENVLP